MDYKKLTDEELVLLAQNNDLIARDTVLERYKNIVRGISRRYYLVGGDFEDLLQEGMMSLFKAIETFEKGKASFKSHVYICVKNELISVVRRYNSDKNKPLNNFISLTGFDDGDFDKSEIAIGSAENPETAFIKEETERELLDLLKNNLSKFEYDILGLYFQGYSYSEIGENLGKKEKSIDNAIQRIKKKAVNIYRDKV